MMKMMSHHMWGKKGGGKATAIPAATLACHADWDAASRHGPSRSRSERKKASSSDQSARPKEEKVPQEPQKSMNNNTHPTTVRARAPAGKPMYMKWTISAINAINAR